MFGPASTVQGIEGPRGKRRDMQGAMRTTRVLVWALRRTGTDGCRSASLSRQVRSRDVRKVVDHVHGCDRSFFVRHHRGVVTQHGLGTPAF